MNWNLHSGLMRKDKVREDGGKHSILLNKRVNMGGWDFQNTGNKSHCQSEKYIKSEQVIRDYITSFPCWGKGLFLSWFIASRKTRKTLQLFLLKRGVLQLKGSEARRRAAS